MNANELRLGNYILNEKGTPSEIREISYYGRLFVDDNLWAQDVYNCEPIPLTKETLLKCGFGEVGFYENVVHKGDFRVHIAGEADCLAKYEANGNCLEIEVKALHQLQNLYFALTGEELKINF